MWTFRSRAYQRVVAANGLTGSMSRVGACSGKAVMESFFALVQKNVPDRLRRATRQELRRAITTWI